MENMSGHMKEDDQMDLPPGFRFHPTDEELISHYLHKKVMDTSFSARAIGEVDLNKSEPWDLPWKAKMGEKEWYFFCVRDRKYPTGLRTNRATESGYWKATGKDKEIYRGKPLVGMKKTLVFYKGRAPKGEKSNWVMHEYRLDGKYSAHNLPKTAKNEWVICRVFKKSSAGKKLPISGLVRIGSFDNELIKPNGLTPLMDSSSLNGGKTKLVAESAYVPCFSNFTDVPRFPGSTNDCFNNSVFTISSNMPATLPRVPFCSGQSAPLSGNMTYSGSVLMPDQSILKALLENQNLNMKQTLKTERELISVSQETGQTSEINNDISSIVSNLDMGRRPYGNQGAPSAITGPEDLECFWTY